MAFSQATILGEPYLSRDGFELRVSWSSSSPAGTYFQLYVNGSLAWWGTATTVRIPWPRDTVRIEVGTVAAGEQSTDFSASLPAQPQTRVKLSWTGGTWEGSDIAGYYVYMSTAPGGPVNMAAPVATVDFRDAAKAGGWGLGGWNEGYWGQSSSAFEWTSGHLANGVWSFAVAAFDLAGNVNPTPLTGSVTITGRPRPPAPDTRGVRLKYTLAGGVPTLTWLASPDA